MEVIYCSRCHIENVPMIKYNKSGDRQYWHCRPCNNKRMRKYGKTAYGKKAMRNARIRAVTKYPERVAARTKLNNAVAKGTVVRPKECSVCLQEKKRIEGHHTDYSKPYDVQWMCSGCHADQDRVQWGHVQA